jgi:hypothetical protein
MERRTYKRPQRSHRVSLDGIDHTQSVLRVLGLDSICFHVGSSRLLVGLNDIFDLGVVSLALKVGRVDWIAHVGRCSNLNEW